MKNENEFFMTVANMAKMQSTCASVHVGAVITKDNRIISFGYNGVPQHNTHCNEIFDSTQMSNPQYRAKHHDFSELNEVHAEINAIVFAWKNESNLDGSTMYVTTFPCHNCAKVIAISGIKRVVYQDAYDLEDPKPIIDFLSKNGVEVEQYKQTFSIVKELINEGKEIKFI